MPTKVAVIYARDRVQQAGGRDADPSSNTDQCAAGDAHTGGYSGAHILGENPCHVWILIHAEQSGGKTFRSMIQQARNLLQVAVFAGRFVIFRVRAQTFAIMLAIDDDQTRASHRTSPGVRTSRHLLLL